MQAEHSLSPDPLALEYLMSLRERLIGLKQAALAVEQAAEDEIARVHPDRRTSARNLVDYLALLHTKAEERLLFGRRSGANLFAGVAALYGTSDTPLDRHTYPMFGAGLQFIIMPEKHMLASFESAQGIEDNHGLILKLGYAW